MLLKELPLVTVPPELSAEEELTWTPLLMTGLCATVKSCCNHHEKVQSRHASFQGVSMGQNLDSNRDPDPRRMLCLRTARTGRVSLVQMVSCTVSQA